MREWRNRYTRIFEGDMGVSPWEFKSPLAHKGFPTSVGIPTHGRDKSRPGQNKKYGFETVFFIL